MATPPASTKDNCPSKEKEIDEVEKKPPGYEQEPPAQESKSTAMAAYIYNVKNLPSELPNEIEGMDDVKKLVSKLLPKLQKEIVDKDNVKKLHSELQSELQKEIVDKDHVKNLLSKLHNEIEGVDDLKKIVSELLPKLPKEIVDMDNMKKLQSELQKEIPDKDIMMKNPLSEVHNEIEGKDDLKKLVSEFLSKLHNELDGMDDVKKLVSKLLPQLEKEIVNKDNVKKLLSELQSKLQKEIDGIDRVKKLLPELQKAIQTLLNQLKEKPRHQPLLLEEETLHPILENFEVSYDKLDYKLRICLLYLSIFPENEVIKKRSIIYWWIANGLIKSTDGKTAEEQGEDLFEELLQLDLIMPFGNGKIPIVNKCRIHPWIRQMLIKFARKANLFDFDSRGMLGDKIAISGHACLREGENNSKEKKSKEEQIKNSAGKDLKKREKQQQSPAEDQNPNPLGTDPKKGERRRQSPTEDQNPNSAMGHLKTIFNVGEQYLFSDIPEWIGNSKKLVALQLGRWQESPRHHIEIQRDDFLKQALSSLKLLKYLSFRGISRITELPTSVFQLSNLEILDLKACHNLENLPDDISALKKLTHFDVSDCYLLEKMPKGLGKLTSLETLKGFIIAESKRTPSRIGDLKSLEKLKRFSIHIGSEAEIQGGEFEKLEELKVLQRLKISWGVVSKRKKEIVMNEDFKFPPSLEKLVLEGLPDEKLPKWLKPSRLKSLKKLYIKGGKFDDLNHGDSSDEWKVEILRLWYMKITKIDLSMVEQYFPYLRHEAEITHTKDARSNWFKNVKNVKESEEERS